MNLVLLTGLLMCDPRVTTSEPRMVVYEIENNEVVDSSSSNQYHKIFAYHNHVSRPSSLRKGQAVIVNGVLVNTPVSAKKDGDMLVVYVKKIIGLGNIILSEALLEMLNLEAEVLGKPVTEHISDILAESLKGKNATEQQTDQPEA